jgi:hypothetical protein
LETTDKPPVRAEDHPQIDKLVVIDEEKKVSDISDLPIYEIVIFPDKSNFKVYNVEGGPDIIIFGQKGKYGVKYSGVGHDGERASKRKYVDDRGKDLKVKGYYGEVSGKFSEILLKKYNVPTVDNKEDVVKILGKDVEFHGRHPEDPNMPGLGWYTRMLGGHPHTKIIVGRPKI